jgi:hypothetical protein
MKNRTTLIIFLLFQAGNVFPAGERISLGGRATAMGGTSVAMADFWSVGNNQAGAAWLREGSTGLCFKNQFMQKELMSAVFGIVVPAGSGTFGMIVNRTGSDLFNEMKAGICYGRKFGRHFAAGVQLDYFRIHAGTDYGNKNLLSCEFGLMYHADRSLCLGVQVLNPVPVSITSNPRELLPVCFITGLSYSLTDDITTGLEVEKDLVHPPCFRAGIDYRMAPQFHAMAGISAEPVLFSFGFSIEFGNLTVTAASEYHQVLGFSPSCSLVYSFKHK